MVGGCWLVVGGCWLVVGGWWLMVGGWWLLVDGWWLVVGGWWLLVGGWWLVVGGWWLVVGGWWLVVSSAMVETVFLYTNKRTISYFMLRPSNVPNVYSRVYSLRAPTFVVHTLQLVARVSQGPVRVRPATELLHPASLSHTKSDVSVNRVEAIARENLRSLEDCSHYALLY